MSFRLKKVVIENFRSIRGSHTIGLDAPIVLVHGPNGTGKTSLLSAIELGLTGALPSLARLDDGYGQYLPHKESPDHRGQVSLDVEIAGSPLKTRIDVTPQAIVGEPILDAVQSRFFSERCYLAQANLGRLLDIYQHQDTRKNDSPLTRFVKELLGLEPLDALIDGLHPAGNVKRLRLTAPDYWAARDELPKLGDELSNLQTRRSELEADVAAVDAQVQQIAVDAGLTENDKPASRADIEGWLEDDADEAELTEFARTRRDLGAAAAQWVEFSKSPAMAARAVMEIRVRGANEQLQQWKDGGGARLDALITELVEIFSDLQSAQVIGPSAAHDAASKAVTGEIGRIDGLLSRDDQDAARIASLDQAIAQGNALIVTLEAQLTSVAGANASLAEALAVMAPHIHTDDCPVCGRDFSEENKGSLKAHVSETIAGLLESAARLQALAQDKATTAAGVATADRERSQIALRRIATEERDRLKGRKARLAEIDEHLRRLRPDVQQGALLTKEASAAIRQLNEINSRDRALLALRASVNQISAALAQPEPAEEESVGAVVTRLQAFVADREAFLTRAITLRRDANGLLQDINDLGQEITEVNAQIGETIEKRDRLADAKATADKTIEVAKDLARSATAARTDIVRQVFNDDLNAVWRELFIRLAPEEPFVPAFALPSSSTGPVEAVLETLYRAGGKGGNPRAMLSAGNLNTAALTLFLALHLSVKPVLPCLIIDDPVQSMDEVHIAQFAALLRTLARQKHRQIVVAVHERSLFDYLALELSPAYLDDRLITVELGRTGDGMTTSIWDPKTYTPDLAVAA